MLYGYAQQLTTYLIDTHGVDQFWALAAAFGDASGKPDERMDQALQQTLGQNADQFDRSWRPWLIARARSFAAPGQ